MTEVTIQTGPKRKDYRKLGVPDEFLNPGTGRFLPGYDAKYKAQLINEALEAEAKGTRPTKANGGHSSAAAKRLAELGWTSHLDKSRESRKAKAERKAKKDAEKAAKSKEKSA